MPILARAIQFSGGVLGETLAYFSFGVSIPSEFQGNNIPQAFSKMLWDLRPAHLPHILSLINDEYLMLFEWAISPDKYGTSKTFRGGVNPSR